MGEFQMIFGDDRVNPVEMRPFQSGQSLKNLHKRFQQP